MHVQCCMGSLFLSRDHSVKVLEEAVANMNANVSKRKFDNSVFRAKEELWKLHEDF